MHTNTPSERYLHANIQITLSERYISFDVLVLFYLFVAVVLLLLLLPWQILETPVLFGMVGLYLDRSWKRNAPIKKTTTTTNQIPINRSIFATM